jgi:hypothetical protein
MRYPVNLFGVQKRFIALDIHYGAVFGVLGGYFGTAVRTTGVVPVGEQYVPSKRAHVFGNAVVVGSDDYRSERMGLKGLFIDPPDHGFACNIR